jgi:membrane protease YdiL (CAAX protease family)
MSERRPHRLTLLLFLLLALTLPTVIASVYFVALAGTGQRSAAQQAVYAAGKVVQFGLPVLFVALYERRRPRWPQRPLAGVGLGLAFGLAVALAMLGLYRVWLRGSPLVAEAPAKVLEKVRELGVDTPGRFFALAIVMSAVHSLLEEYYWRWFVFGRLREVLPLTPAVLVSALGFTSHHVIIVSVYLPGHFLDGALLLAGATAAGGAFWAWLYERTGSLVGPWLGHALVDAAIFAIGWDLVASGLG